MKVATEVNLR